MCHRGTTRARVVLGLTVAGCAALPALAQTRLPEWQHIGNAAVDAALPSMATGAVEHVWYSADGARLFAEMPSRKLFVTSDFETWTAATGEVPPPPADDPIPVPRNPEPTIKVRREAGRIYAIGQYAYRSDDGGVSWADLTQYKHGSILGAGLLDLAISPRDPDELAIAARTGVWRSVDGGLSWTGLNQSLPNLPVDRIISLPTGSHGLRIDARNFEELEWMPGEKQAWRPTDNSSLAQDVELRRALSQLLGANITAAGVAGDTLYAGAADGHLWVSSDRAKSWLDFQLPDSGPVERFWVDPKDPRIALAALGARPQSAALNSKSPHVLRTVNGGVFWDDLTSNLPDAAAHGVAADPSSGALYLATDLGVFATSTDLTALAPAAPWVSVSYTLPAAAAMDVRLDADGNRLYAALAGYGVYETIAPHRSRDPRVVNAADYSARAVAPGTLLSVLGAKIDSARAGDMTAPVLAASDTESEIQVPFEATGASISLALNGATGRQISVPVPLETAAPAIFVDRDGAPLLVDTQSGVLLDAATPAHSGSLIQILATGLGRVKPDWPTGMAAPLQNPPSVVAPVSIFLDGQPVEVTRAVLAPGYIGFYLIEVQLPKIVNYGPEELYLQVDGHPSNRVQVFIQP